MQKDTNECTNLTVCSDNATCINLIGSYECRCQDGFKYINDSCQGKLNLNCKKFIFSEILVILTNFPFKDHANFKIHAKIVEYVWIILFSLIINVIALMDIQAQTVHTVKYLKDFKKKLKRYRNPLKISAALIFSFFYKCCT
jgi:hypothetical protein